MSKPSPSKTSDTAEAPPQHNAETTVKIEIVKRKLKKKPFYANVLHDWVQNGVMRQIVKGEKERSSNEHQSQPR